jgi:hypothetical protein
MMTNETKTNEWTLNGIECVVFEYLPRLLVFRSPGFLCELSRRRFFFFADDGSSAVFEDCFCADGRFFGFAAILEDCLTSNKYKFCVKQRPTKKRPTSTAGPTSALIVCAERAV